jgi:hypothetical protein
MRPFPLGSGQRNLFGSDTPSIACPVTDFRSVYYLLETALLAPGIIGHEAAHALACRLSGVAVTTGPVLNPFARDAHIDHERVDSFPADLAIAVAPLPVNSVLGIGAFAMAELAPSPVLAVPSYWLGVCFALTAFPSVGDTRTLYETARTLPPLVRPLGYVLAVPVRTFTRVPGSAGFVGFFWIFVLYELSQWALAVG